MVVQSCVHGTNRVVMMYWRWRRIRQSEHIFKTQVSNYTGTGSGGHNQTEPKEPYRTRTPEDYAKSEWGVLLQKLEDNPNSASVNKEFEREVRVPYPLFKDIVNRVRDQP
jgi:hypothetical protein